MDIEEQLLTASIRNTINQAERTVAKLFNIIEGNIPVSHDEGENDNELQEAKLFLQFLVEKAFRDTAILAERLGLPAYRADIIAKLATFNDLTALVSTPWDVISHSLPLAAARVMYESLAVMTKGREVTGLGVFETILESTPQIIDRANLQPANEADVRKAVRDVLKFAFRDVVKEIPIPQTIKVYRPDIGVRSLMAAAEYKFIDSEDEAKAALDGVFTDMHGYTGHPEWRSFYAVLYMTRYFYTQKQIDDAFLIMKADLSWRPLVMVGPGQRRTTHRKQRTPA